MPCKQLNPFVSLTWFICKQVLAIGLDRAENCEIRSIIGKIYSNKAGATQFSRAAQLTQFDPLYFQCYWLFSEL